ncbi:MAG: anthranilate phosphoribosyltransferase [Proteobacteria bacterium]|nr:MAG: anthranilate phosphoribosyltransferase [Pseudomonadota bacterium]
MDMQSALKALTQRRDLSRSEMQDVMTIIMEGEATPAQIGAFLVALNMKGETVNEITGAATVMRGFAAKVDAKASNIVDCVGTGGDGAGLFNVSTASALVVASAGISVAKHGNRAATGKSGSADLLEAAGVNIALTPAQVAQCIDEIGIGFMFAPTHHGATRHAIGPRREIAVRNIFNLLGPLTNPAGARRLLVGVFSSRWLRPIAEVFHELGAIHVLVVHSDDDLDEISLAAPTSIAELKQGEITEYSVSPDDFGLARIDDIGDLAVDSAAASLETVMSVLSGVPGPAADMVALNAGATIYAADRAESIADGVKQAREILREGRAANTLKSLAEFSGNFTAG